MRTLGAILLLAFLPLVHLAGTQRFLIFDDLVWLQEARAHPGLAGAARSFVTTPFGYRPVAALHLRAAGALAGSSPGALHLLDLLTVGLAAIAAFLFARNALGARARRRRAVGGPPGDARSRRLRLRRRRTVVRRPGLCRPARPHPLVERWPSQLARTGAGRVRARDPGQGRALLTLPALLACDGGGGETRRLPARLRRAWPELAIGALLATRILMVALERGRGGLVAYRADPAALGRFGRGLLYSVLPSGWLQGRIGQGLPAALVGVVAVVAMIVLWRRSRGAHRALVACVAGWLLPVVPYANFDLPSQARYVAPAALPAMLLVCAAIAAGTALVRGCAVLAIAAVVSGAGLGLLRSAGPVAPLRAGPGLHLVVIGELLGFPENARRSRLDTAELSSLPRAAARPRAGGGDGARPAAAPGARRPMAGRLERPPEAARGAGLPGGEIAAAKGQERCRLPAFWPR